MSVSDSLTITAAEWTEIEPNGTEIVLQNEGERSIRVHIDADAPSTATSARAADGVLLAPRGDPMTFALEDGDSLWVRVNSVHDVVKCRLNVWQEAA